MLYLLSINSHHAYITSPVHEHDTQNENITLDLFYATKTNVEL